MKLSISIPSISGLLSRFRKRGGEDPEDQDVLDKSEDTAIGDDEQIIKDGAPVFDDDPAEPDAKPKRRWGRIVAIVAAVLGALFILVGIGALVGWLVVNAELATEARTALHPTLTVAVLAEGSLPRKTPAGTPWRRPQRMRWLRRQP